MMKRSMISIALLIAGLAVVADTSTAEARACRTHRHRCCRTNSSAYMGNQGYQMNSQNNSYVQISGGYAGDNSPSPIMSKTNANQIPAIPTK